MQKHTKGMAETATGRSWYARLTERMKRFHANEFGAAGDQPPDPAAGGAPPVAEPNPPAAAPKPAAKPANKKPDDLTQQVRGIQGTLDRVENERREERRVLKEAGFESVAEMAAALKRTPRTEGSPEDREPTKEDFTDPDTGEFDSAAFTLSLRKYDRRKGEIERQAEAASRHSRSLDEAMDGLPEYLLPDPSYSGLVRDLLDDRATEAAGGEYGGAAEARRGAEEFMAWFDAAYAARKAAEDKAAVEAAGHPADEPPPPPAGAGGSAAPPKTEGPPQSRGEMRDRVRQSVERREAEAQARRSG